jgi:cupin 2 domain-containing protein
MVERTKNMKPRNLFSKIPESMPNEIYAALLKTDTFKLERIVSAGQPTPPGVWFDDATNEWVILLRGSAGLLLEGEKEETLMGPGDYIHIPAHKRHRVEWTDRKQKTVWLALHYK